MKTILAAFDFDGTITQKDSLLEFIRFSRGKWRLYGAFLLFSPLLVAMKLNVLSNEQVKQWLFTFLYRGIPVEVFNNWGAGFSDEIDKMLCAKTMEIMSLHKEVGNTVVIISASIANWIKPWAERKGVDIVLATQIEINQDGLLTGKFLTKNCYGQEKVNRLLELFPNRSEYHLVVYGDSSGDNELIAFADSGFRFS